MGYSILIIDDDQELATALSELLSFEGYITRIANNGLSGLRQIQTSIPDIVVCDWQMPNFNGNELLRELRLSEHTKHVPFIIITGHGNLELDFETIKILTKPVSMHTLLDTITQEIEVMGV